MRASNVLLAIVLLVPSASDAQIAIRPGEYEVEMQMDFGKAGGAEAEKAVLDAAGFQKNKRRECITPEDVKTNDVLKLMSAEMEDMNCKMSDNKTVGNKLTFMMTCVEDGMRMTWATEMTFGPDSFTSVTKGKDPEGRPVVGKATAKRIGECKK
ncbi:MAG: DUF3617 family protein [Vicinamibacterales bacterium]